MGLDLFVHAIRLGEGEVEGHESAGVEEHREQDGADAGMSVAALPMAALLQQRAERSPAWDH
jgi:hypothetical protein